MKISRLPPLLVDQIKAGEVLERPGFLIKELLENSIDAGANFIKVVVTNGGLESVFIQDNGCGIEHSELPKALERHSTSKLFQFDDLQHLTSYGFRGEALASIAAVAKIKIVSRTAQGDQGIIEARGGAIEIHERTETPLAIGTQVLVTSLFFNTPVRLKFLSNEKSELTFTKKIISAFLLSYPHISWDIKFDENDKEIYLPSDQKSRLAKIWKTESHNLWSKDSDYNATTLQIYSAPKSRAPLGQRQFIFVNGRIVEDTKVHHLFKALLGDYWEQTSGPYALFLEVPAHHLDANVHPNKTKVKFIKSQEVYALITASLKAMAANRKPLLRTDNSENSNQINTNAFFRDTQLGNHQVNDFLAIDFERAFFIDNGRLYLFEGARYFVHSISQLLLAAEVSQTPLLVASTLEFNESKFTGSEVELFQDLSRLGIDIERIGPNELMLRAVPSIWFSLPYEEFIQIFLKHIEETQDKNRLKEMIASFEQSHVCFSNKKHHRFAFSSLLQSSKEELTKICTEVPFP